MKALGAVALAVCSTACADSVTRVAVVVPMFGPAIGDEVIAGRAEDLDPRGPSLLLAGERTLVQIDLKSGTSSRHPLRIPQQESCWGLARLRDGSTWTIKSRSTLLQVASDGAVIAEHSLGTAHFGLFGAGDRLVYQPADFTPPAQALFAARPPNVARTRWADLKTRPFRLARASVAALNMIACGAAVGEERPCWFPDEAALALIDPSGHTRRLPLPGLTVVSPEVLLTSDTPARPIRDAFVDVSGTIWVLSSGAPVVSDERPGAWLLARYAGDGSLLGISRLPEPVRLILRAEPRRAVVITGSGMVAEVRP